MVRRVEAEREPATWRLVFWAVLVGTMIIDAVVAFVIGKIAGAW